MNTHPATTKPSKTRLRLGTTLAALTGLSLLLSSCDTSWAFWVNW